jgi:hypothetical protein
MATDDHARRIGTLSKNAADKLAELAKLNERGIRQGLCRQRSRPPHGAAAPGKTQFADDERAR